MCGAPPWNRTRHGLYCTQTLDSEVFGRPTSARFPLCMLHLGYFFHKSRSARPQCCFPLRTGLHAPSLTLRVTIWHQSGAKGQRAGNLDALLDHVGSHRREYRPLGTKSLEHLERESTFVTLLAQRMSSPLLVECLLAAADAEQLRLGAQEHASAGHGGGRAAGFPQGHAAKLPEFALGSQHQHFPVVVDAVQLAVDQHR